MSRGDLTWLRARAARAYAVFRGAANAIDLIGSMRQHRVCELTRATA